MSTGSPAESCLERVASVLLTKLSCSHKRGGMSVSESPGVCGSNADSELMVGTRSCAFPPVVGDAGPQPSREEVQMRSPSLGSSAYRGDGGPGGRDLAQGHTAGGGRFPWGTLTGSPEGGSPSRCPSPWALPAPISSVVSEDGGGPRGSEELSQGTCPKPLPGTGSAAKKH